MRDVVVLGVSMTKCGKFPERSFKDGALEAVEGVIADAGISKKQVQATYVSNVQSGAVSEQVLMKGQAWLRPTGLDDITIINTENVCASGGTAFYLGMMDVASGFHDCVLVLGVEKTTGMDKATFLWWVDAGRDMDDPVPPEKPFGMNLAGEAERGREYMKKYGLTKEQLAKICVKNHYNASLNPWAHYRQVVTVDEVLGDPLIDEPIHRMMCATVCDGSAAAILCSPQFAKRYTNKPIFAITSVQRSSSGEISPNDALLPKRCAEEAYERAGIGPSEIDVWEVSDATSFTEAMSYENLGLCAPGEASAFIDSGASELTGRSPVNPSGGFESRGHPFAATGIAQITELVWQLRGDAGKRQVTGSPKLAAAQCFGGHISSTDLGAVCSTTIIRS